MNFASKDVLSTLKLALIGGGLMLALASAIFWGAPLWRKHRLMDESKPVMAALRTFHHRHGHYPSSLTEVSIATSTEIYYQLEEDGSYTLWFGMSLGDSVAYHSSDQQWEE